MRAWMGTSNDVTAGAELYKFYGIWEGFCWLLGVSDSWIIHYFLHMWIMFTWSLNKIYYRCSKMEMVTFIWAESHDRVFHAQSLYIAREYCIREVLKGNLTLGLGTSNMSMYNTLKMLMGTGAFTQMKPRPVHLTSPRRGHQCSRTAYAWDFQLDCNDVHGMGDLIKPGGACLGSWVSDSSSSWLRPDNSLLVICLQRITLSRLCF